MRSNQESIHINDLGNAIYSVLPLQGALNRQYLPIYKEQLLIAVFSLKYIGLLFPVNLPR